MLKFLRLWRPARRAVICDLDETLCTGTGAPIPVACAILNRISRAIRVHYVTARPESSRAGTEKFLQKHRLPDRGNLHLCPDWKASDEHKAEVMKRLARQYHIVVSVGDADEDENAARAAGIPFVRVGAEPLEPAWRVVDALVRMNW